MASDLPTPTLETVRFALRKLVRDDAAALLPTLGDPAQCRYLLRAHFESEEELADWLCDPEWDGRSWSAIDKANGELVARVVAVPAGERTSELGYTTVAHRRGERIAEECSARLIEYLFTEENHHRLTADTDPRNVGSNRVLEKLGFRLEGHRIESIETHIGWCDEYYWAMLAREWRDAKGANS